MSARFRRRAPQPSTPASAPLPLHTPRPAAAILPDPNPD